MYANEPVGVRHHIENAADGTRFMRSTGRPHHCSPRFRLRSRRAPVLAGHVSLDEPAGLAIWGGEMMVNRPEWNATAIIAVAIRHGQRLFI
jgi:hypothetical protein